MPVIRMVFMAPVVGAFLLTCAAGCANKVSDYTPDIAVAAKDLKNASVEVHIVGVSKSDYQKWADKSMTEYWKPDDALRTDAVKRKLVCVMQFGGSQLTECTLKKEDPKWQLWGDRNVEYFFVLADLPGAIADKPGAGDPRRMILPALPGQWHCRYWGERRVDIEVTPSGLTCTSKYNKYKE